MNIELRKINMDIADEMTKYLNNENISRYMTMPYPYTKKDAESFINTCLKSYENNDMNNMNFAIYCDGKYVGGCGYERLSSLQSHICEAGYWIAEPYWKKGITPVAYKMLIDIIFENTDIKIIQASIFKDNIGSRKVAEKCGMKVAFEFEDGYIKDGKLYTKLNYILKRKQPNNY